MKIEDICTKTLITVNKNTPAKAAAKLMLKHDIGSLVVVSMNQPIGIVTRGDMITKVIGKKNMEAVVLDDIMSNKLIKTEENNEVLEAAKLMADHNVKHILVIKSKLPQKITRIAHLNLFEQKPENSVQITPPMVGIISASDILKRLEILNMKKKEQNFSL
ncbi:CBS domain-containing protein [Candidatus Desantisbacteria bacterium]|nr:CBS domain-containing protein [Candidatus Desantisbacteria bacterium]